MNATRFPCHTDASAPRGAAPGFETATARFGMVPNLIRTMCSSPQLAEGYLALSALFDQTSLSVAERHVVLLTVSARHECHYCMAAHSITADMNQVPGEITEALRGGQPLPRCAPGGPAPVHPCPGGTTGLGGTRSDERFPRRRL